MKKVLLLSAHYLESKRRAGFHWLAEAFWRAGWQVTFFTTSISWLSYLVGRNHRLAYPILQEAQRIKQVRDNFYSYVWFTPWHPARFPVVLLNNMSHTLFAHYGKLPLGPIEPYIRDADMFIFESGAGLLLFDRFKSLNSHARYVYRASDILTPVWDHPALMQAEERYVEQFDLISIPGAYHFQRFAHFPQARLHFHGLNKDLFDHTYPTPYQDYQHTTNAIYVGTAEFDYDFLERASRLCPTVTFHIIGPISDLPQHPNIVAYGEKPFTEIVPFMMHADIGLNLRAYRPDSESFADNSLKNMQYTYCRLPIIAPSFMKTTRWTNMLWYEPEQDESIQQAMDRACAYDRASISTDGIHSWDDLARILSEENGIIHS